MGAGDLAANTELLARPDIGGVQVVYSWKRLEPTQGHYDFSEIEADLALAERLHKKLFIQIQDRFFMHEHRNVPRYLLEEPRYGGGLAPQTNQDAENQPNGAGWVAMQWNPAVRERFQALLSALAKTIRRPRLWHQSSGNLGRHRSGQGQRSGFDCDALFRRRSREHPPRAQGVPQITRRAVRELLALRLGRRARVLHAILRDRRARTHRCRRPRHRAEPARADEELVSVPESIQGQAAAGGDGRAGRHADVHQPGDETKFTHEEFVAFARDYLGVDVIFWDVSSPWLKR